MAKLPSFQFYPGDWQKDLNLRRCSHAAKGVWMDMLCLMHESEERGVLITGNCPWSDKDVAAAVGGNADVTLASIAELLSKGVLKQRESDSAFYCARMVREEEKRLGARTRVRSYRQRTGCNADCNAPVTGPPHVTPEGEREDEEAFQGKGSGENPNLYARGKPREAPTDEQWTKAYGLARTVIAKLNLLTKARFSESVECTEPIANRLFQTSYDLPGCLQMVERQVKLWKDDPRASQGLTPQTLFGEKFEKYYGQREMPIPNGTNGAPAKPKANHEAGF